MPSLKSQLVAARSALNAMRKQLDAVVALQEQSDSALALRNAALDSATTQFMIVDARQDHCPIIYVNRALVIQHGYQAAEDLIGRSVGMIFETIVQQHVLDDLRRRLTSGCAVSAEAEIVRRNGTKFWAGFTVTPLLDRQGNITHYVTLGADITVRLESMRKQLQLQDRLSVEVHERERVEIELRLAQKLESIGRFAAGLAHEINTPIQYVGDSVHYLQSAFADQCSLLQSYREALGAAMGRPVREEEMAQLRELESAADFEFLRQEAPKSFTRAFEGVERVAGIVRAMKEFAYPHGEEHVPADLNHALATTLTVARSEYKYAAQVETQFGELPLVPCHLGELNQVFLNLLVNAAHAIQDSGQEAASGRITINTQVQGEMALVSIADNGCGIPPENLHRIFDPFYTTKEVGRGSGQGLAIARSIVVDRHGGRIDVSSTPGKGTQFVVQLPLRARAAKAAAA